MVMLLARLDEADKLVSELQARIDDCRATDDLTRPRKAAGNSSLPQSKEQKSNRPEKSKR